MKTVLLVDDDADLRAEIAEALSDAGFNVAETGRVADFEAAYAASSPDAVILDMGLPDGRGMDIARDLRRHSDTPILFLSGRNDEIDRIVGLELGADDFIQKPCSPRELVARINAVIRRTGLRGKEDAVLETEASGMAAAHDAPEQVHFEGFVLNLSAMELAGPAGQPIPLTTAEFQLLEIFVQRPKRVLNRDQLLDLLRGENWAGYDRTIDGLVSRLRKKLSHEQEHCNFLKTIRGAGYMFSATVSAR